MLILAAALTFNTKPACAQEELPLVYVDPPLILNLLPPQTFTVAIRVVNVSDLYGVDIQFRWDPAILDYVSHVAKMPVEDYPEGILYEGGTSLLWLVDEVDAPAGNYQVAAASLAPAPSFNGTGTIFEITFQVIGIGTCLLELWSTDLARSTAAGGGPIIHEKEHGFFDNFTPPPAEMGVDPSRIVDTGLGPCNNFTVDVMLEDVFDLESLEFWMAYDTAILDVTNVTANPVFTPPATIEIFEAEGKMRVAASASPPITGVLTLANITFHVTGSGESVLDLFNLTLLDAWGEAIPYKPPIDGYFSNIIKAKLFVEPAEIIDPTLTPGHTFSIDIQIDDVFDLYGYSFQLFYETAVLTALGAIIVPPTNDTDFFTELGIDDQIGEVAVNVTYYPPAVPITILSNTTIVTIYFQVQSFGCTVLDLHDTELNDQNGDPILHDVGDGFFCTIQPDVAIVRVEPSKNMVYPDRTVDITVVARNVGDTTETFNVTAYYDNYTIGTKTVYDLPPRVNRTLTFMFSTTGLEPCNNYTISARADPVPHETNTGNNYLEGGWVKIKILGDVNGDGQVDIYDIVIASDAYRTMEGDPDYVADADLAPVYGLIDIYDIVTVAYHYGEGC